MKLEDIAATLESGTRHKTVAFEGTLHEERQTVILVTDQLAMKIAKALRQEAKRIAFIENELKQAGYKIT